jgi:hypothetical protein
MLLKKQLLFKAEKLKLAGKTKIGNRPQQKIVAAISRELVELSKNWDRLTKLSSIGTNRNSCLNTWHAGYI